MNTIKHICLILWMMAITIGCKSHKHHNMTPPVSVEIADVKEQLLSERIWFTSTTQPIHSVTIEPRVNGYLKLINYKSGAPIVRGDTIFQIDPSLLNTSYYSALASLESAQASFIEAKNNYDRAIPLAKIAAISRSSLDEYTASYAAAKSNIKAAEEELKSAELNLSYATITAPISGLIAETPAAIGDYVGVGTEFETLTTISNIDSLTIPLAIPTATYLKYVDNKNSYNNRDLLSQITLILADSSEYALRATYDYTQKDISSGSSSVVIYAKVANPEGLLKADMFTRVKADIGEATPKLLVPQKSVTQLQGVNSVWVINSDSTATFRVVDLGATYEDLWHITSGLKRGEVVATSSQLKLHEGAKVIPIKK